MSTVSRQSGSPTRLTAAALIAGLLSLGIAACGSSGSKHASTSATSAAATTSSSTPAAAGSQARQHQKSSHAKHHAASTHKKKTTSTTSHTSTTTSTTSHTSTTTPASNGSGGSSPKSSASSVPPLPGPVVSGSAGGLRATLHGESHAPTATKLWHYSVLATDASSHPLSGTVDTQFVFGGAVVGREAPPTHQLTHGRLNDAVTFPKQAVGIPLTFQVVVHTHLGSVTLNWAVKTRK